MDFEIGVTGPRAEGREEREKDKQKVKVDMQVWKEWIKWKEGGFWVRC